MHEWTAEVVVDHELAAELIGEQFPKLAGARVRALAEGWDNTVFVIDETWAFRFPRREVAVPLLAREVAVLPRLEPLLTVPISTPVFVGRPADAFPWPFSGCPFLRGLPLESARLGEAAERVVAAAAGRFLRRLHGIDALDAVSQVDLPEDPNSRADMSHRVPTARKFVTNVAHLGLWEPPPAVERLLDEAAELPPATAPVVVHGDLHFRHVLVDAGDLAGVIDWGDVSLGNRSIDLQLQWSFSPHAREAFLDAYGRVSDDDLLRSRVIALSISAMLARYGHVERDADVARAALAALAHVATAS